MTQSDDKDAFAALDRFFETLRQEVRSNPGLARRLLEAVGTEVTFDAEHMAELFDPIAAAAAEDPAAFAQAAAALTAAQLRGVFKRYNLATPVDLKGLDREALAALLETRARMRLGERRSGG